MGIALVKEAMSPHWSTLSPFARLVLVHMATTALDKLSGDGTAPRLYYAGHGPLLLFVAGVGEELAGTTAYESARKRVARAIAELVKAGAVRVVRRAVNGSHAVYEMTTSSIRLPVDNHDVDGGSTPPKGLAEWDTHVPLSGTPMSLSVGHPCPSQWDTHVPPLLRKD